MEHIKSQLDNIQELSAEEVAGLEASIVSEFDSFADADLTPQSVEAMSELADMLDSVRGEVARREAEAAELAVRAAEASSRVRGEAEAAAPVEDEEETPEDEESEEEEPVVASAEIEVEDAPTITETEASVDEEVATEAAVEEIAEAPETPEAEASAEAEEASVEEAPADTEASAEVADEAEASAEAVEEVTEASAEVAEEAEASAEVSEDAEASNTDTLVEPIEAQEEAHTVTAAAEESFEAPVDRRPVAQASVAPVAITAGADIPGVTAGSTINDMSGVAKAFSDRLHTLSRARGGDGEQHTVAVFNTEYPESRVLNGTAEENWSKIVHVGEERQAIVASGGYGTPIETRYDIFGFGTDARPVKDSLPKFQATRGGLRFVKPPVLSSYADAVGIWTEANDIEAANNDGTGDTVKNVLVVEGAVEDTAGLDAVTLQLQVGNLLSRAYPELVARHNELALIQHAREAELNILAKMSAESTAVTTAGLIGFARDFLVNIKRSAAAYRSRHRIAPDTRLQAIIPMWVYDAMAADLTLNMPGDQNLDVSKGEINGFLATSNVSLTASYDLNTFGAQGAGALLEFPDTFDWFLFSEGSFLFLDGGTLDIGIVRDSTLVSTNDYRMFVESFEGLAFVGIESLKITSTIAVNGAAAALRDTTGGATAAAAEY